MLNFTENPIIAHRGASAYAPENTMTAFDLALAYGCQWIEFDVVLSKDREPYVMHDTSLSRTTNGQGVIHEVEAAYLETLDAGQWFAQQFQGEKIPHLKEVLKWLIVSDLSANIEIKAQAAYEEAAALAVLSHLKQYWPSEVPLPLITSFQEKVLTVCRHHAALQPLGLIVNDWDGSWQKRAEILNCVSIHMNYRILTQERIKAVKQAGFQLLSYTINRKHLAERLLSWGVDALFSDYPDLLV